VLEQALIALSNIIKSRGVLDVVEIFTINFEASVYQPPPKNIMFKCGFFTS